MKTLQSAHWALVRKAAPLRGKPYVSLCMSVTADFSAMFTFACSEIGVVYKYFCTRIVCSSAQLDSELQVDS